jgi:hypothetical protein
MSLLCAHCNKPHGRRAAYVNRAAKCGLPLYCDRRCAGLARRTEKPPLAVRRALKREYDIKYRLENREYIRERKREDYQAHRDPVKERRIRKANMARHVAYCRKYYQDPKRKAFKVAYDKYYKAKLLYGDNYWAECHVLLVKLEKAVRELEPNKYERAKARGYYGNGRTTQERKRNAKISRW